MNNTQKNSKKNTKSTGPKNALKSVSKGRQQEKSVTKAINYTDSEEEIVVWTKGYFGLTQNIDEKRGPKYKCTECLALFNTRLSFLTHSKYHLKPFCILCGIYTNTQDEMANHKINNHKQFIEIVKPIVETSEGPAPLANALLTPQNNVQMGYSVLPPQNDDIVPKEKLLMNNSQYPIAPNGQKISELVSSVNNSVISNASIIPEHQNEFIKDNPACKNMEVQSSLVISVPEIKEPRSGVKKTFKSRAKVKIDNEKNLTTPAPKTKFSRSGRCITMKSFNY